MVVDWNEKNHKTTKTTLYSIIGTAVSQCDGDVYDILLDVESGIKYFFNRRTHEMRSDVEIVECRWCRLKKWWRRYKMGFSKRYGPFFI